MLRQVCCLVLLQLCSELNQLLLPVLHLGLQLTNGRLSNGAQLHTKDTRSSVIGGLV